MLVEVICLPKWGRMGGGLKNVEEFYYGGCHIADDQGQVHGQSNIFNLIPTVDRRLPGQMVGHLASVSPLMAVVKCSKYCNIWIQ